MSAVSAMAVATWSGGAALAWCYLLATPFVARRVLMRSLERFAALPLEAARASGARAVVVLPGDGRHCAREFGRAAAPGPLSLERLRYAAFLARGTGLPVLLVGGSSSPPPTIARRMAESLREDFGVEPRWVADRSRDTLGNGEEAAAALGPLGIGRVLLVTHAWHMPRAVFSLRSAGLEPVPAPTAFAGAHSPWRPSLGEAMPCAEAFRLSSLALHEMLGLVAYRLRRRRAGAVQPRGGRASRW